MMRILSSVYYTWLRMTCLECETHLELKKKNLYPETVLEQIKIIIAIAVRGKLVN